MSHVNTNLEQWENDALDLYYQSRKEYERKRLMKVLTQKAIGLAMIALSIADAVFLQDLTLGVVFVPVGLYVMVKGW